MTYLEIIKRNHKEYFYLTKNTRVSQNKWRKKRVYLGNKKPSQERIKKEIINLEKQLQKEGLIRYKHRYAYLSNESTELLQDLKENYDVWSKKTSKKIKEKTYEDFMIRFTYNTNAIEGNRLTLRQTALILKDKLIPSGIRAEDYNEAINGKECLEYIKKYKKDFKQEFMLKINEILTKNTGVASGGRIRFFNVQISGATYVPPKHEEVKGHISNLMKWHSKNKNKLHSFELATLLHAKIAWIHPFEDGNGRTARTLMNFILMKKGYPMFFIPFEKREEYYDALELYDKGNKKEYIKKMLDLIKDQISSYGHKEANL
ncbi:MAG: Fic family protein [Nanoarchaeota archaeon]|nr:Fic family protein [Nanoarchaeota archaeon]